jgi:hypothetical protein
VDEHDRGLGRGEARCRLGAADGCAGQGQDEQLAAAAAATAQLDLVMFRMTFRSFGTLSRSGIAGGAELGR